MKNYKVTYSSGNLISIVKNMSAVYYDKVGKTITFYDEGGRGIFSVTEDHLQSIDMIDNESILISMKDFLSIQDQMKEAIKVELQFKDLEVVINEKDDTILNYAGELRELKDALESMKLALHKCSENNKSKSEQIENFAELNKELTKKVRALKRNK